MVKTKYDRHCVGRHYAIFERAKFNRRSQEEGESVDSGDLKERPSEAI